MANVTVLTNLRRNINPVIVNHVQKRFMPVNVPPTATGKRRFRLSVETDPQKLVNYCCGLNYHIDEPLIPLKPDNEYPDWLWELRLGPKPNSWDMEKGTKEYYLRLAEEGKDRNYLIKMSASKTTKVVSKVILGQQEYVKRLRFAALAHLEDDAGLDAQSLEADWWGATAKKYLPRDFYLPMNDNRVLYMDKIPGNSALKNYKLGEDWTFRPKQRPTVAPPKVERTAIQDSRRRDFYSPQ